MKRAIIGGFFSMTGIIWEAGIMIFTGSNSASEWVTSQGRFLASVEQNGMTLSFALASMLLVIGLLIMTVEYFKTGKLPGKSGKFMRMIREGESEFRE